MSADTNGSERKELYLFAGEALSRFESQFILDIACGNGEGSRIISSLNPAAKIIGVDLDNDLIQYAENHFKSSNVSFIQADALKLDFPNNNFTHAVCFHTIEHFNEQDQRLLLKELSRVLKPQSKLIIATPDRDVWTLQGIAGIQEDHIRELNQKEFTGILKEERFKNFNVFGQGILKSGNFAFRRLLNLLKRIDIFNFRRVLLGKSLDIINHKTQPITVNFKVQPLKGEEKASITVIVCDRP
ncbi:MAG: class I SAM-dependent methyltransferase [Patescibacteria group bacterium]|mgnify:CR=1 FL=1